MDGIFQKRLRTINYQRSDPRFSVGIRIYGSLGVGVSVTGTVKDGCAISPPVATVGVSAMAITAGISGGGRFDATVNLGSWFGYTVSTTFTTYLEAYGQAVFNVGPAVSVDSEGNFSFLRPTLSNTAAGLQFGVRGSLAGYNFNRIVYDSTNITGS